jgi:hypothetical protein
MDRGLRMQGHTLSDNSTDPLPTRLFQILLRIGECFYVLTK